MALGLVCILASIGLLAYNQWENRKAEQASAEVLTKLETVIRPRSTVEYYEYDLDPDRLMTAVTIDGWQYIGTLSIPSIDLELPIMAEWSYAGLKIAPGRYSGTTYAQNMVICGHNYAKHFSPIKWLPVGTEVQFTDVDDVTWYYEITSIETLKPTQIEDMIEKGEDDDWDLTLFTCTTGGTARYAVRCTQVFSRVVTPAEWQE